MQTNFVNPAFHSLFQSVTNYMPSITFGGIIGTYLITAGINIYFVPLPYLLSIPAALALQFGRFAIVFIDFLNPTGKKSSWPLIIASSATLAALVELYYSIHTSIPDVEKSVPVYLFLAMIIISGYVLEINFIRKGYEAYEVHSNQDNFRHNTGTKGSTDQEMLKLQETN